MTRTKKILLGCCATFVVILGGVLAFGELRYGLVRGGQPESHARFVGDTTRARIIIRPLLAQDLFEASFPTDRKPPAWLLARVLPHELAFIFSPKIADRQSEILLYINEQRFGPVVANIMNQSGIMGQYDYLRWDPPGLKMERRGSIVANGTLNIPAPVSETAMRSWGLVQGLEPLDVDGGHFLEAVFDNRDGGAFALMCALYDYGMLGDPQAPLEDEVETFLSIASIHVSADATVSGDLDLIVRLESAPSARGADIDANAFNLEVAIGEFSRVLRESYGAEVRGRAFTEGATVTGRYTVKGVAGIISTLLSAQ